MLGVGRRESVTVVAGRLQDSGLIHYNTWSDQDPRRKARASGQRCVSKLAEVVKQSNVYWLQLKMGQSSPFN